MRCRMETEDLTTCLAQLQASSLPWQLSVTIVLLGTSEELNNGRKQN
jgi:hypothetical protein